MGYGVRTTSLLRAWKLITKRMVPFFLGIPKLGGTPRRVDCWLKDSKCHHLVDFLLEHGLLGLWDSVGANSKQEWPWA